MTAHPLFAPILAAIAPQPVSAPRPDPLRPDPLPRPDFLAAYRGGLDRLLNEVEIYAQIARDDYDRARLREIAARHRARLSELQAVERACAATE